MIDPAISVKDGSDYTGITVVSVDSNANWYFRLAKRERLNPTQIVELPFQLMREFNCQGIGIESVAFQKVLIHIISKEMATRRIYLPLKEVKVPTDKTKEMRIMGALVPLFEWGRAYLTPGMTDFEKELLQFPRSKNDDISDSAAHLKEIVFYPPKEERNLHEQPAPQSREYESYIIRQLANRANENL
jgi:phage terminase large subunit-like protein